ncbi:hypothetical protein [Georgenia sp. SYP-B2076]|uniref:hypothetical protein n=1 Tax=Georgenia sp. SYP-B2076 TaxID=2495881 RepID=UPI000F8F035E|nr:hypothetical protein [Georgenia sp. SYP-B2076]
MTTILQKAVTPQMSAAYLERGLDRVAGYVLPAAEVAQVATTEGLFELHGLGFPSTPFAPDRPIDVLHVPQSPTAVLVSATGGTDAPGRLATGGPFLEHPPFTGTGFASTGDVVAPLSWLEHTRLTPGSRLWRFTPGAPEPELVGTYHGVAFGWQNHLDGDSFHALAPSKYVGHVAKLPLGTFAADVKTDDDGAPSVVTLVAMSDAAQEHGFTKTTAGTWAKQVRAADVDELFEIHVGARWHGMPVRIVDQGPGADGEQFCRISSLAHDADLAERLHMDKVDAGVYETTVPLSALTDVVYAQRIPKAWAREEQLARSGAGAAAGAPADHPLARHSATLQRVAQGLAQVAPAGWTRARVLCRMVGTRGEILAGVTQPDGTEAVLPALPGDVGNAMAEMRHAQYEPGKGTWFTALVTLMPDGKITLNIDSKNEPTWSTPLEPGQFSEDLRRYPRDDEHVPDWLTAKLAEETRAGGEA